MQTSSRITSKVRRKDLGDLERGDGGKDFNLGAHRRRCAAYIWNFHCEAGNLGCTVTRETHKARKDYADLRWHPGEAMKVYKKPQPYLTDGGGEKRMGRM